MKLYRVTTYDYGTYGPRGMTLAGTGLNTWAATDKTQAFRHYNAELKSAIEGNRKINIRLQLIATPDRMDTRQWITAIVTGEVPYTIIEVLRRDRTNPAIGRAA